MATEHHMFGEWLNMPDEEYRNDGALNFSLAKHALKSPLAYAAAKVDDSKPTSAMELGTLAHSALLEPHKFEYGTMCAPEGARRGSKAWNDAQVTASARGKKLVKQSEYDRAKRIADSVRSNPDAMTRLVTKDAAPWLTYEERQEVEYGNTLEAADSRREASYFWTDQRTGLQLKARVDCVSYFDDFVCVVDFKTTEDASPRVMGHRLVADPYHYLIQLAWYCRAIRTVYDQDLVNACIIAAEKGNGFTTGVYDLTIEDLEIADKKIDELLDKIVKIEAGEMDEQMHYKSIELYPPDWWYKENEGTM